MGLVSLFFALRGIMEMFRYLKAGVSVILFFIGAKMSLGFVPAVGGVLQAPLVGVARRRRDAP